MSRRSSAVSSTVTVPMLASRRTRNLVDIVRHPPRSGWLDEQDCLKGSRPGRRFSTENLPLRGPGRGWQTSSPEAELRDDHRRTKSGSPERLQPSPITTAATAAKLPSASLVPPGRSNLFESHWPSQWLTSVTVTFNGVAAAFTLVSDTRWAAGRLCLQRPCRLGRI